MAQAIVLAAGSGSRARTNKMLLSYRGRFLVEHAIDSLRPFVSRIIVVTGHYHEQITAALIGIEGIEIVYNAQHESGMFSSILSGLAHVDDDLLILPGDCPLVRGKTIEALLSGTKEIRVPSYEGHNGHPLFISRNLLPTLRDEPPSANLKLFRNRYDYEIIKTDDPNILIDIDTIADYRSLNDEGKE